MADNTVPTLASESRAESERSASPSPFRASGFTPYNINEQGQPRRLKHVSQAVMQAHLEDGTIGEDNGPEPGFRGQPHGTDYSEDEYVLDEADEEDDALASDEEGLEAEAELSAPDVPQPAQYPQFYNGVKRKRPSSPGPAAQVAASAASSLVPTADGLDEERKRGRKAGGPRKETARPWTDAECIALIQLYVDNPRAIHKTVAEMHHAKFWHGDTTWEGRTFSACQQRLIALNSKSRDRARLPGVLAVLKSAFEAAGGAEADDNAAAGRRDSAIGEMEEVHGEIGGESDGDAGGEMIEGKTIAARRPSLPTQPESEELPANATDAEAARLLLSLSSQPF